jgi:hypothetical protein
MRRWITLLIILALVAPVVSALPANGAATLISSNNVTLAAAGVTAPAWFEYGLTSGSLIWRTPNDTTAAAAYTRRIYGSPLMGGQKFYYRACDVTGCGAESDFTLLTVTPQPTTTFGYIYQNVTESGFDPAIMAFNAMEPYMWPSIPSQSVVWGLIFLFIFAGLWFRGRDVTIPVILGLIVGFIALNPAYGVGMPPQFVGMSQGIAYASVAGIIMAIFKK